MTSYNDVLEAWREAMVSRGHAPRLNYEGKLDVWFLESGYHNGPGCETCFTSWCMHCDGPDKIGPCTKPVLTLEATTIRGRLT